MSPNKPSLLCLLTDVVSTHLPCACLGQSHVPKARVSCLCTPVAAMFKGLAVSSPSCAVPDTCILSSRCLGPNVHPPGQPPRQLHTSPRSSLSPVSIHLLWKEREQRALRGEQSLWHPCSLAKDSCPQCRGLGPCSSETTLASLLDKNRASSSKEPWVGPMTL